jgi:hypothetical protein
MNSLVKALEADGSGECLDNHTNRPGCLTFRGKSSDDQVLRDVQIDEISVPQQTYLPPVLPLEIVHHHTSFNVVPLKLPSQDRRKAGVPDQRLRTDQMCIRKVGGGGPGNQQMVCWLLMEACQAQT